MNTTIALILAAGKGTRMKSTLLKVAHKVGEIPMINRVLKTTQNCGMSKTILIGGHQIELLKDITQSFNASYVLQKEQLGTGHAVMQAIPELEKIHKENPKMDLIILAGDCPLITEDTLEKLHAHHVETNASASILSTNMKDPAQYGRILRNPDQSVIGIREAKDCTEDQLTITEINSGIYCVSVEKLLQTLPKLTNTNKQNEYYLTDIFEILKEEGSIISCYCTENSDEVIGINSQDDLKNVTMIVQQNHLKKLQSDGIKIMDTNSTFIAESVVFKGKSIIHPFTTIEAHSVIGNHTEIGKNSHLHNVTIEDNQKVPPFTTLISDQ